MQIINFAKKGEHLEVPQESTDTREQDTKEQDTREQNTREPDTKEQDTKEQDKSFNAEKSEIPAMEVKANNYCSS